MKTFLKLVGLFALLGVTSYLAYKIMHYMRVEIEGRVTKEIEEKIKDELM